MYTNTMHTDNNPNLNTSNLNARINTNESKRINSINEVIPDVDVINSSFKILLMTIA